MPLRTVIFVLVVNLFVVWLLSNVCTRQSVALDGGQGSSSKCMKSTTIHRLSDLPDGLLQVILPWCNLRKGRKELVLDSVIPYCLSNLEGVRELFPQNIGTGETKKILVYPRRRWLKQK
jgi:hypothetical protein